MVKSSNEERRATIRAKRVLSIQYRLSKSRRKKIDKSWHLSTTHDMSLSGLSFYSEIDYKAGETLEVIVVMSGVLQIFKGMGKIIRIEEKTRSSHNLIAINFPDYKRKRTAKNYTATTRKNATTKRRSLKRV